MSTERLPPAEDQNWIYSKNVPPTSRDMTLDITR